MHVKAFALAYDDLLVNAWCSCQCMVQLSMHGVLGIHGALGTHDALVVNAWCSRYH